MTGNKNRVLTLILNFMCSIVALAAPGDQEQPAIAELTQTLKCLALKILYDLIPNRLLDNDKEGFWLNLDRVTTSLVNNTGLDVHDYKKKLTQLEDKKLISTAARIYAEKNAYLRKMIFQQ